MKNLIDESDVACFLLKPNGREPQELKSDLEGNFPSLVIQVVAAETGSNERFFRMIAAQTLFAMRNRSLLARKPELDLLLRLGGTTQISEALAKVGYRKGSRSILVAVGTRRDLNRLMRSVKEHGVRLEESRLSKKEMMRIEEAAVLSARRN